MRFQWPTAPQDSLLYAASLLIGLCVTAVLMAVAANFVLARGAGGVARRRRSPVATATMLAFAGGYYLLVHDKIGVWPLVDMRALVPLTLAGCALVVCGAAVNILGRLHLGSNWADQVTIYNEQGLVTTGVFGMVRHPLYASLIWIFVGVAMAYHNAAALAAALCAFVPAMALRARQEETLLAEAFPEYAAYQRAVGMLWPRLRRRR